MVATAGLSYLFYEVLHLRGLFIGATLAGWAAYVVASVRREPARLAAYGLSRAGLRETARAAAVVFAVGALACLATGLARGTAVFRANMLLVAILYPVWGLVQQVLVQGMVVRNLKSPLPPPAIAVAAGVLFGVVHLPHLALAAATAVLGAVFSLIFLRHRNLWPLGLCHGWLGVLFYAWVLGRDPWHEIVG